MLATFQKINRVTSGTHMDLPITRLDSLFDPRGGLDPDLCDKCQNVQATIWGMCEDCFGIDDDDRYELEHL